MDTTPQPDDSEHDRLYKQASALVFSELPLHNGPHDPPSPVVAGRLRTGIELLNRVLVINPRNWAAMWMTAMAHRRLNELEAALTLFQRACEFCGANPDVPREAGLTAMTLGRYPESIQFMSRAIQASPGDAGLVANLALAHLFNQDVAEAKRAADYALKAAPSDAINQRIVRLIDSVLSGKRACPRHVGEI
jgi:tetratricopeptide (TPR) repeat protein